jgi:hypothetical protein
MKVLHKAWTYSFKQYLKAQLKNMSSLVLGYCKYALGWKIMFLCVFEGIA